MTANNGELATFLTIGESRAENQPHGIGMPVREAARRLALSADDLEMISRAYGEVLEAMGLEDHDDRFCQTVANDVVDIFERGNRDRQLVEAVLKLYR